MGDGAAIAPKKRTRPTTAPLEIGLSSIAETIVAHNGEGIHVTSASVGRVRSPRATGDRYHTHCDPRLNGQQTLELAFLVAEKLKADRLAGLRAAE